MEIIRINELVYAEPRPATVEARQEKHDKILADLNLPIYLGRCTAVTYDHKSDRYAVTSAASERKLTLKASNDVVAFIAAHIDAPGYWQGRLESGTLVDASLIQA